MSILQYHSHKVRDGDQTKNCAGCNEISVHVVCLSDAFRYADISPILIGFLGRWQDNPYNNKKRAEQVHILNRKLEIFAQSLVD